jgi:flagellin
MPVVSTNTTANTTIRYLNFNASDQSSSVSKISSGSRIVKASDDAAGAAISANVTADVRVLEQATINASHAISILQIADGAAAGITDILSRMRALATQASSATVTDTERGFINSEFTSLVTEIDSIALYTRYKDRQVISNLSSYGAVMVGSDATDVLNLDPTSFDLRASGSLAISGVTVDTQGNAVSALSTIEGAMDKVMLARSSFGAQQSQFEFQYKTLATSVENLQAVNSTIEDVDVASEQAKLTSVEVKVQAAVAATATANQMPQALLKLMQ